MSTATKTLPNFTTQSAAAYKANIDAIAQIHDRVAGAFAPQEVTSGSPTPTMAVYVNAGAVLDLSGATPSLVEAAAQTVSGFTTPSAGQHRVDRVVVDPQTGVASRVAGTAVTGSPSAVAPAIPAGKWPVCQVLLTDSDTAIFNDMITDERVGLPVYQASMMEVKATTSGTSVDFTPPSGCTMVVLSFRSVSTNGTSNPIIQLGTSGSPETTGYVANGASISDAGASTVTAFTNGFGIVGGSAANELSGQVILALQDSSDDTWSCQGQLRTSAASVYFFTTGYKALSGDLDLIRITTAGGVNTFDNGEIGARYSR